MDKIVMEEFYQYDTQLSFDSLHAETGEAQLQYQHANSYWEVLISIYLPLAALWLRRCIFGINMLVRTAIVGHLMRLVFGNVLDRLSEAAPVWLSQLVPPVASHTKLEPHTWPPALTALAGLTCFALVVHPDGITWIVLGKARNALFTLLQSGAEVWQLVISDIGVIPSIIAFIALAAVVSLMFIMLRSAIPQRRQKRTVVAPEKKKKKKKGLARHRTTAAKTKTQHAAASSPALPQCSSPISKSFAEGASAPDLSPLTPNSSAVPEEPQVQMSQTTTHSSSVLNDLPETSLVTIPVLLSRTNLAEKDVRGRSRVPSVSTVDTTAMSDDQSWGSASNRSHVSTNVGTSRPSQQEPVATHLAPSGSESQVKGAKKTIPGNRNRRSGSNEKSKALAKNSSRSAEGHSRWDALKPSHNGNHPHQTEHHGRRAESRNQSQQSQARSNPRRPGRGAGTRRGNNNASSPMSKDSGHRRNPGTLNNGTAFAPSPRSRRAPNHVRTNCHRQPTEVSSPRSHSATLPHQPPSANSKPQSLGGLFDESTEGGRRLYLAPKATSVSHPYAVFPTTDASLQSSRPWWADQPTNQPQVSASFLSAADSHVHQGQQYWMQQSTPFFPSSARMESRSQNSPSVNFGYAGAGVVKENPFAPDTPYDIGSFDEQIEADLQELGGQMAGSILDF